MNQVLTLMLRKLRLDSYFVTMAKDFVKKIVTVDDNTIADAKQKILSLYTPEIPVKVICENNWGG